MREGERVSEEEKIAWVLINRSTGSIVLQVRNLHVMSAKHASETRANCAN